jgi:hypothetical protein
MPIENIVMIPNRDLPKFKPVKESMEIFIPNIIEHIPRRNGFIWAINGSGGSGKTSMMLNFFRTNLYRKKFSNIFYFCPQVSFMSVQKHPFENHPTLYHELNVENLTELYKTLKSIKEGDDEHEDEDEDEDKKKIEYNLVIIDDFADTYKSDKAIQKILSTMMIKARHLNTAFIFTLQSYHYFPKILRKQLTNITIFKPKNIEEWNSIADELLNMKKNDAKKVYDYVFDAPYQHLDIDTTDGKIYKNFNLLKF